VVDMIQHQDGVDCTPVWVEAPTRTITTVLENRTHRQTAFFEPGPTVTDEEAEAFIEAFVGMVDEASVVTFNGTVPDRSIDFLYQDLIAIAKERGVLTILDSHGREFESGIASQPYMVKPNVAEAEEMLGAPLDTREAQWHAVDAYHARGVTLVVLSLGKQGALVSREGVRFHVIPPQVKEVNPVGSGDALVAGFAIGLQENVPIEEAARLGVAAGAANAMSWDIGHFTCEEVESLIDQVVIEYV